MRFTKVLTGFGLAASLALIGTGAQAHAHLLKSSPAADATVAAPAALELSFSEKLEPKFSAVELMTAKGDGIEVTSAVDAKDGKSIKAAPKAPLKPGAYMVMWRVVSADGHKMKGDYNFTVK